MHKGKDGLYSQRSILGSLGFVGHMLMSAYGCYKVPDTIPAILGINVGLIAAVLGYKLIQNIKEQPPQIDTNATTGN